MKAILSLIIFGTSLWGSEPQANSLLKFWDEYFARPTNTATFNWAASGKCSELPDRLTRGELEREKKLQRACSGGSPLGNLLDSSEDILGKAENDYERALINRIAIDLKSDLQCKIDELSSYDKDPRAELGAFCTQKKSLPEAFSASVTLQVLNAQDLAQKIKLAKEILKDVSQVYGPHGYHQIATRSLPPLSKRAAALDIKTLDCSAVLEKRDSNSTRKEICLHILDDQYQNVRDSVWGAEYPAMQNIFDRLVKNDGNEDEILRSTLCSKTLFNIHDAVIKSNLNKAKQELEKIKNIGSSYGNYRTFVQKALAAGLVDAYTDKTYASAACTLQAKYGLGSEISSTVIQGLIDVGFTVTTGGLSMVRNFANAGKLLRGTTKLQRVTRLSGTTKKAQFAWDMVSSDLLKYEAFQACFGDRDLPQPMLTCRKTLATTDDAIDEYNSQFGLTNCGLQMALATAGYVGLRYSYADAFKNKNLKRLNVRTLKKQHASFTRITPTQNKQFIELVENQPQKVKLVYNAENTVLKEMNDSAAFLEQDKALASALTNAHKELLLTEIQAHPQLTSKLIGEYSDYKHLRLAFSENTPEIRAALQTATKTANQKFEEAIKAGLLKNIGTPSELRGIAADPKNWFMAGVGRTVDEAGAITRVGKSEFKPGVPVLVRNYDSEISLLEDKLLSSNELLEKVQKTVATVPGAEKFMEPTPTSQKLLTPNAEVIDIFRKAKPVHPRDADSYFNQIRLEFRLRYGVDLSTDQITTLQSYINSVDIFSPGLLIGERSLPNIANAESGIVSVDFSGVGARNLAAQMKYTAGLTNVRDVINSARASEKIATRMLDQSRQSAADSFKKIAAGDIGFSGDDGLALPSQELTQRQKEAFLTEITSRGPPSDFRVTYLGPRDVNGKVISVNDRAAWISRAEGFEKEMRRSLNRVIPHSDLRNVLLAVDLTAGAKPAGDSLAGSSIRVLVPNNLPPSSQNEIKRAIDKYLREYAQKTGARVPENAVQLIDIRRPVGYEQTSHGP